MTTPIDNPPAFPRLTQKQKAAHQKWLEECDKEVKRLLEMSDAEVWAEAVRTYGSPANAEKVVEHTRQCIKRAMDKCLKMKSPLKSSRKLEARVTKGEQQ